MRKQEYLNHNQSLQKKESVEVGAIMVQGLILIMAKHLNNHLVELEGKRLHQRAQVSRRAYPTALVLRTTKRKSRMIGTI